MDEIIDEAIMEGVFDESEYSEMAPPMGEMLIEPAMDLDYDEFLIEPAMDLDDDEPGYLIPPAMAGLEDMDFENEPMGLVENPTPEMGRLEEDKIETEMDIHKIQLEW